MAAARKLALEIEAEAAQGIDRVANAEEKRLADERDMAACVRVREVLDLYIELHLAVLSSGAERRQQLEKSLASKLSLHIGDLQTGHLQAVIDEHIKRGKTTMANRIRAALRAFTKWAYQRGYLSEDIGARIAKASREKPRDRVLSVVEMRKIYNASDDLGPLWGPLIKLMILTGQRRGEIVGLQWSEVELPKRRIVKAGSQTKNGKAHVTHLSDPALEVLQRLDAEKDDGAEWVFSTTGTTPVSGISKAKDRLNAVLREGFEPWTLHDLRTGLATALAEAGESETVVDRILNHVASGSAPSAVARVYQRGDLLPQRATALDRWAAMVTGQDSGQVVPFLNSKAV